MTKWISENFGGLDALQLALETARVELAQKAGSWDPRVLAFMAVRMCDMLFVAPPADGGVLSPNVAFAGVPVLLRLVSGPELAEPGWPPVVSSPQLEFAVAKLVRCAAAIGVCERAASYVRGGLGTLTSDGPNIEVKFPQTGSGIERFALEDDRLFRQQKRRIYFESAREELERLRPNVRRITRKLVAPWRTHFIRYDAHPFLDKFFYREAHWHCAFATRFYDTFDEEDLFGNIPFRIYGDCVVYLVALAFKHIAFVEALLSKRTEMRVSNLLTIVDDFGKLVSEICRYYGDAHLDPEQVRVVLETLAIEFDGDEDTLRSGEPLAPLIRVGDEFLLRSIQGALDQPFYHLLKKLRRQCRSDWDRAVNGRERRFVDELEEIFLRSRFLPGRSPSNLVQDGRVLTDVDFAIFEPSAETLGVFQLKWQDPLGTSPAERASRASNFVNGGNGWVEAVSNWISRNGADELLRVLGLPKSPLRSLHLFVIGRTDAQFSGPSYCDNRSAWGNWPQLVRLVAESWSRPSLLDCVHNLMNQEFASRASARVVESREEWDLAGIKVRVSVE